jgi:flagellar hook-length control protein FliK
MSETAATRFDPGLGSNVAAGLESSCAVPNAGSQTFAESRSADAATVQLRGGDTLSERLIARLSDAPNGQLEMEVQLEPPALGRLIVKLVRADGGLRASFVVTNESARTTVQNEMPALQRALEQAGVTLTEFSVAQQGSGNPGDRTAEDRSPLSQFAVQSKMYSATTAAAYAPAPRLGGIDLKV